MSDQGADLQSALEVKPNLAAESTPGASPGDGAGANGSSDDRKALNYAKEAVRRSQAAEAQVKTLEQLNRELLDRVTAAPAPAAAPEPPKTPFSQEDLSLLLQQGRNDEFNAALQANQEFAIKNATANIRHEISRELSEKEAQERLMSFVIGELGINDATPKAIEEAKARAQQIKQQFPNLDEASALVYAMGGVWKRSATGELELDDLRDESKRRGSKDQEPEPASSIPDADSINWDAANRGLPSHIVDMVQKFGLGRILKKGRNPEEEAHFRSSVTNLLSHHKAKESRSRR